MPHHGSVLPLLLQVIPSRDHAVINRCSSMMTFLLDKFTRQRDAEGLVAYACVGGGTGSDTKPE